jgi:hypothetical protein
VRGIRGSSSSAGLTAFLNCHEPHLTSSSSLFSAYTSQHLSFHISTDKSLQPWLWWPIEVVLYTSSFWVSLMRAGSLILMPMSATPFCDPYLIPGIGRFQCSRRGLYIEYVMQQNFYKARFIRKGEEKVKQPRFSSDIAGASGNKCTRELRKNWKQLARPHSWFGSITGSFHSSDHLATFYHFSRIAL